MCNEDGCFAGLIVLPFQILSDIYIISLPCYYSDLFLHFRFFQHIIYHIKSSKVTPKKSTTTPHFHMNYPKCVCFLLVYVLNPAPCLRSNLPRNRDVLVGWQDLLNEIASSSRRLRAARGGAQDAAGGAAAVPGPGRSRSPESRPRPVGFWGGFLEGGAWD